MFKGKAHLDVASVLALTFGFSTIMWILFCIRHVPLDNHDKSQTGTNTSDIITQNTAILLCLLHSMCDM